MLNINLNIQNPWSNRFENLWNRAYDTPFKHKFIELEVIKDNTIVSFGFRFATRQDHAGLTVEAGLLGHSFLFQFYDIRHWNTDAGRYYIYDEENGSH